MDGPSHALACSSVGTFTEIYEWPRVDGVWVYPTIEVW
jgi:hypothetical protein